MQAQENWTERQLTEWKGRQDEEDGGCQVVDPSNGSNGSNGSDPDVHRGGLKEGLFWGRSVFPEKLDIFWKKSVFFFDEPNFFFFRSFLRYFVFSHLSLKTKNGVAITRKKPTESQLSIF